MKNLSFFISAAALFAIGTATAAVNVAIQDQLTSSTDDGRLEITPTTPTPDYEIDDSYVPVGPIKDPIIAELDPSLIDTEDDTGTSSDDSDTCGITFPTCDEMGYKTAKSDCATGKYTVCPSDPNKVRCLRGPSIGELKYSLQAANHGGWVLCNGQTLSRTKYSDLFKKINTYFGSGDGSSTFAVPDYRGFFLRGYGAATNFSSYGGSSRYSTSSPQKEELPNITGTWTDSIENQKYWAPTGAISQASSEGDGVDGGKGWFAHMVFDASRSNSIYKENGHVIPANYGVNIFIYSGVKWE